eukprot:TRINITY_DN1154_c0_g1_i5.p1 TRINITY_DN1154_c0_g1~~TRINITY_DN1154_c0_g1_i5.p1  ORF type:complete len:143 (+),score=28.12 TRINITY_DN1154_c0_g1_i5:180-608(+)
MCIRDSINAEYGELAAPGLKKENITIEAEENILKIASKSVEDNVDNDKTRYTRREFNYKNFERSFKLPENIKIEDINASYESGILRITLPKIEEKKTLKNCLLYTSDAADDLLCVDLGGRRIIKKKKKGRYEEGEKGGKKQA